MTICENNILFFLFFASSFFSFLKKYEKLLNVASGLSGVSWVNGRRESGCISHTGWRGAEVKVEVMVTPRCEKILQLDFLMDL